MNAKPGAKGAFAAATLLGLLACLLALSGGLGQLTLHPGDPAPRSVESPFELAPAGRSSDDAGTGFQDLLYIVSVFVLASCVVVIVLIVVSPTFRRMLTTMLVSMIYVAGFLLLAARLLERFSNRGGEVLVSQEAEAIGGIPDAAAVSPPTWSFAVVVGALAVAALAVGAFLFVRLRRYWRRRKADSGLGDLVDAVALSADRIRAGADLRSEVIRCYQEMVNILSRRKGQKPTYLTPREFVDSLRDVGMTDLHIDRLTSIFELVRYGRREDARFAEEALSCLDAIRDAYGALAPTT
jgi:hypothetical protein